MKSQTIIFILILCFFGCQQSEPLTIESATLSESNETDQYKIRIEYPKAKNKGSKALNKIIQANIDQNAQKFKTFIQDFEPSGPRVLFGQYRVHLNEYPLVSIEQRFEWAVPGVSILLVNYQNVNYNLESGEALEVKDVFIAKVGQKELRREISAALHSSFEDTGCAIREEDPLEDFVFNKTELLFFVDLYQGNPMCQWEVARLNISKTGKLLNPEFGRFFLVSNNPKPDAPTLGKTSPLTKSLNGTYQFSIKSFKPGKEDEILGHLTLKDGSYQYVSANKSPYRYAFILQSKGNYEVQYLSGINESTHLNTLPTDTLLSNISFEIYTDPGDQVIKEFQMRFDKASGTLNFQTLLSGIQLWKLQKPI